MERCDRDNYYSNLIALADLFSEERARE